MPGKIPFNEEDKFTSELENFLYPETKHPSIEDIIDEDGNGSERYVSEDFKKPLNTNFMSTQNQNTAQGATENFRPVMISSIDLAKALQLGTKEEALKANG